jgi:hypothetical protein
LYSVEWQVFLLVAAEASESSLHDKSASSNNSAILSRNKE